jgi:glycosyltransferase involved in cell wall biosynthesis
MDTQIVSGPGRQLAALAAELRSCGVEQRVYMFQRRGRPLSPFADYLKRAGIKYVVTPERGPLDTSIIGAVRKALWDWQPDIVQTHNYRTTVLGFLLRRLGFVSPWIAFFHGATSENLKVRLYNLVDRMLLPKADRLVVMSEIDRRSFRYLGGRVQVIHNAVLDIPSEDPPISLADIRRASVPAVGFVGRLSHEKGADVLFEAAARLRAEGVPLSIIVAGAGPERRNLERQATILELAGHVHFLGPVRDVTSLYSQLDLVVLPSRSEGLPNVLLEALHADIPVVATAVNGVPEVLSDSAAGEMVPPDDPQRLAEAIARTLRHGRSPAAKLARREVTKRFSLSQRVARHLTLYAELRPDRISRTAKGGFTGEPCGLCQAKPERPP